MEIPRHEERFTPAAVGAREVARLYGAKVGRYTTAGDALHRAATERHTHPAHEGGYKEALSAVAKLTILHARANVRPPYHLRMGPSKRTIAKRKAKALRKRG